MLSKARKFLRTLNACGFDRIIVAQEVDKNKVELKTFVGSIVLMHHYFHTRMYITNVTREMMRLYPKAVNQKILQVKNEGNVMHDLLVATELYNQISSFVASNMTDESNLEEVVDALMAKYFIPQ
jgi:hypothetical protein